MTTTKHFKRRPRAQVALLAGLTCLVTLATRADSQTIKDDFERSRNAGTSLNSEQIGTSENAWEATPNVVVGDTGSVGVTSLQPFVARVRLPEGAKEVTAEAEIRPQTPDNLPAGSPPWVAVGIGSSPTLANPSFGGVFLIVYPNGVYNLMFNPEADDARSQHAVSIKSGRISTWNSDGMNRIKIVYEEKTKSISAFANGDELLVDAQSLEEKNFSLVCEYAGFSGFSQPQGARIVDEFSVAISK